MVEEERISEDINNSQEDRLKQIEEERIVEVKREEDFHLDETQEEVLEVTESPLESPAESVAIGKIEAVQIPAQEAHKETESSFTQVPNQGETNYQESKNTFIAIAVILGVFIIAFAGFKISDSFNTITAAPVVHLDDLHAQNVLGELSIDEGYMYKDFSFVFAVGLWWTQIIKASQAGRELIKFPLHYGPKDLVFVDFSGELEESFASRVEVFLAIDPLVVNKYYSLALSEISFNMAQGIGRKPIGSCTEEGFGCENREIVSCDNNPHKLPVIELELVEVAEGEPEVSKVEFLNDCIKISGSDEGITKAADYIILGWYGVIERGEQVSSILSISNGAGVVVEVEE